MRRSYLLFDIDGTLLNSDGAGRAALERAFAEATGVAGAMANVAFQGRTDRWILGEVTRHTGIEIDREAFLPRYYELLGDELARREPEALPGAHALLEALAARDEAVLGLGTGNLRCGAFLKLAAAGLDGYLQAGGFGDDHLDRAELLREGADAVGWSPGERLVVVGDTEHDVRAGRAIGAFVLAVATGTRTVEELRALDADAVCADLTDLEGVIAVLLEA